MTLLYHFPYSILIAVLFILARQITLEIHLVATIVCLFMPVLQVHLRLYVGCLRRDYLLFFAVAEGDALLIAQLWLPLIVIVRLLGKRGVQQRLNLWIFLIMTLIRRVIVPYIVIVPEIVFASSSIHFIGKLVLEAGHWVKIIEVRGLRLDILAQVRRPLVKRPIRPVFHQSVSGCISS